MWYSEERRRADFIRKGSIKGCDGFIDGWRYISELKRSSSAAPLQIADPRPAHSQAQMTARVPMPLLAPVPPVSLALPRATTTAPSALPRPSITGQLPSSVGPGLVQPGSCAVILTKGVIYDNLPRLAQLVVNTPSSKRLLVVSGRGEAVGTLLQHSGSWTDITSLLGCYPTTHADIVKAANQCSDRLAAIEVVVYVDLGDPFSMETLQRLLVAIGAAKKIGSVSVLDAITRVSCCLDCYFGH